MKSRWARKCKVIAVLIHNNAACFLGRIIMMMMMMISEVLGSTVTSCCWKNGIHSSIPFYSPRSCIAIHFLEPSSLVAKIGHIPFRPKALSGYPHSPTFFHFHYRKGFQKTQAPWLSFYTSIYHCSSAQSIASSTFSLDLTSSCLLGRNCDDDDDDDDDNNNNNHNHNHNHNNNNNNIRMEHNNIIVLNGVW